MKKQLPIALIYSRLLIGGIILFISISKVAGSGSLAVILLTVGLLTDIFDGIIARQLKVSTQRLRRLDSTIDQIFFMMVVLAAYVQCPSFFKTNAYWLILLLSTEALTYLVSFLKFRKEIATHTIGAKVWTLTLFATLVQVMLQCQSTVLFSICFWVGILTRVEIISIILILKRWANDIPTFFHAIKIRQGKEIKRHKLFNG